MFGEKLKKKYALTDKGLVNTKKGAFWTVIVNLIMMAGMGILFFMMQQYMDTLVTGAALPKVWFFLLLLLAFVVVPGTFGAYGLFLQGAKEAGAMRAALLNTAEPVTATIATVLWLKTSFTAAELIGFALILAMVFLTTGEDQS